MWCLVIYPAYLAPPRAGPNTYVLVRHSITEIRPFRVEVVQPGTLAPVGHRSTGLLIPIERPTRPNAVSSVGRRLAILLETRRRGRHRNSTRRQRNITRIHHGAVLSLHVHLDIRHRVTIRQRIRVVVPLLHHHVIPTIRHLGTPLGDAHDADDSMMLVISSAAAALPTLLGICCRVMFAAQLPKPEKA